MSRYVEEKKKRCCPCLCNLPKCLSHLKELSGSFGEWLQFHTDPIRGHFHLLRNWSGLTRPDHVHCRGQLQEVSTMGKHSTLVMQAYSHEKPSSYIARATECTVRDILLVWANGMVPKAYREMMSPGHQSRMHHPVQSWSTLYHAWWSTHWLLTSKHPNCTTVASLVGRLALLSCMIGLSPVTTIVYMQLLYHSM